jgi:hypothetical protein
MILARRQEGKSCCIELANSEIGRSMIRYVA